MYKESFDICNASSQQLRDHLPSVLRIDFMLPDTVELTPSVWYMHFGIRKDAQTLIHIVEKSKTCHQVFITSHEERLTSLKIEARKTLKRILNSAPNYGWIVKNYSKELLDPQLPTEAPHQAPTSTLQSDSHTQPAPLKS